MEKRQSHMIRCAGEPMIVRYSDMQCFYLFAAICALYSYIKTLLFVLQRLRLKLSILRPSSEAAMHRGVHQETPTHSSVI